MTHSTPVGCKKDLELHQFTCSCGGKLGKFSHKARNRDLFFCAKADFPANSHQSHYFLIVLWAAETKFTPPVIPPIYPSRVIQTAISSSSKPSPSKAMKRSTEARKAM